MPEGAEAREPRATDRIHPVWSGEVRVGPLPEAVQRRLVAALTPESGGGVPGTTVRVREDPGGMVVLTGEAPSTATIRAALNAHLRWVGLALKVDDLAQRKGSSASPPGALR